MRVLAILALAVLFAAPAGAATLPPLGDPFDGEVKVSGGTYDVDGNRLGFVSLRWAQAGDVLSGAVFDAMTDATVLGIYSGTGLSFLSGVVDEFTDLTAGVALPSQGLKRNGKIDDAVWVLWEGTSDAVFTSFHKNGKARQTTVSATVTLPGNPLTVIPLPAPVWLLLTALGGLALAGRVRGRSATS